MTPVSSALCPQLPRRLLDLVVLGQGNRLSFDDGLYFRGPVALPPDLWCRGKNGILLGDDGPRGVGSAIRELVQPSTSASASLPSPKDLFETSSDYPTTSQTPHPSDG
ncbi:hypothetical protein V6N11_076605 [Hibiscus sabdariffa]|uniref:Uncharacterized protein n=1 Tax=Hibiscus sabdariffa TaxID=183260 RepID=A0ABR2Q6R2_9ROSI